MAVSYYHINQSLKKIQLLRHRFLHHRMSRLGLHPSQLPILEYINRNAGCTQVEISEDLALTPAAIALATKRLQSEKLLEKKVDEHNLRRNILNLTDRGRSLCEETRGIFDQFDQTMYRGLEQKDLERFQNYLDRITINITGEETNVINPSVMTSLMRQVRGPGPETELREDCITRTE